MRNRLFAISTLVVPGSLFHSIALQTDSFRLFALAIGVAMVGTSALLAASVLEFSR